MSALSGPGPAVPVGTENRRGSVRLRLSVGAGVGLVLIAAVVAILMTVSAGAGSSEWVGPHDGAESALEASAGIVDIDVPEGGEPGLDAPARAVFVHVLGAVAHPGLYQVVDGARVVDVISAAGGLATDADPAGVNLARFVSDGEQLYVPMVGEEVAQAEGPGPATAGGPVGLININRASQAELELLPRVGPALAERIIAWRESFGTFTSIEDLMSVTGIGEKTFDGLKDFVTT